MSGLQKCLMIGLVFFIVFQVGCVHDEANRYYLKEQLPAKNIDEVVILNEEPPEPYIIIADLQVNNATFKYMQKRAAEIGADAVIIVPAGGWYSREEVWADRDRHSGTFTRLIGTAIKYK